MKRNSVSGHAGDNIKNVRIEELDEEDQEDADISFNYRWWEMTLNDFAFLMIKLFTL